MPETPNRREREDEIIDKVLKGVAAQTLTKLDLVFYCGALVAGVTDAHRREDAIRKLSRQLDETLVPSGREFARRLDAILDGA